jgi:general secretion pathway protein G
MILRHTEARAAARATPRPAFTLMEVLVVAAIIVILAGVGGVVYTNYLEQSKEKAAYITVMELSQAVERYKVDNGAYPQSLDVLAMPQDGKPAVLEQSMLRDPWGNAYQYEPGNLHQLTGKPRVYAAAPDGKIIANW